MAGQRPFSDLPSIHFSIDSFSFGIKFKFRHFPIKNSTSTGLLVSLMLTEMFERSPIEIRMSKQTLKMWQNNDLNSHKVLHQQTGDQFMTFQFNRISVDSNQQQHRKKLNANKQHICCSTLFVIEMLHQITFIVAVVIELYETANAFWGIVHTWALVNSVCCLFVTC